ncbi:MAG: LacI family DNA-binding transcriptional regulator [Alphaproteobacteria bacterium]|nr:LacI family DNA-binding transcriptional regulator [Alphaproteobacteria bacterium]
MDQGATGEASATVPRLRAAAAAGKATVKDIARIAGVSVSTVSRVLNNPGLVTAEKRAAVLGALHSHDYIPNQHARSLISRRSRAIGLVVPTISNPVFAPTMGAIERELTAAGYALLISCCERDPEREFAQVRTLIERGVDGLLITGSEHLPALPALLARYNIPYVSQDIALDRPMGPSVALDNAGALATAIDHLVAQGHRGIAVLSGPVHNTPPIRDRFDSAAARIRHHGLPLPPDWCVVTADYESHSVRAGAQRLLDSRARPTAVALTGDILALALVAECRARGLGVPRDISIIGCGDTNMGQYVDPPLTTVRMPFAEMGTAAALSLLALIAGQRPTEVAVLSYELVRRQSVAPPAL